MKPAKEDCMREKITQEGEPVLITKDKEKKHEQRVVTRTKDLLRVCLNHCPHFKECEWQMQEMIDFLSR